MLRQSLWLLNPPPTSEGNNDKVPGGGGHQKVQESAPTQKEGGLLLPIHDEAGTVCAKFMFGLNWGQGWMGAIIRTPLISLL